MKKAVRQEIIIEAVNAKGRVGSTDLAHQLEVSEDTIRRDLNELAKNGFLKKIHGGAESVSLKLFSYNKNLVVYNDKKEIIAKKAAHLIKNGTSAIISGGTTNLTFVRFLPHDLKATIYTYCLPIALELASHPNIELFFIGGKIEKNAMVTIGLDVMQRLTSIKTDYAFLGTEALSEHGMTEESYEVSCIKRQFISGATHTISLITSEKIGVKASHKVCNLSQISTLVTELDPSDPKLDIFHKNDIKVL